MTGQKWKTDYLHFKPTQIE